MTGLGTSIMLESEARGVILSAEVFKAISAGEKDNAVIAEQCGCTEEKVAMIRKAFGI